MQLRVFLDANVIIEAFRIDVWGELARGLHLETVEMCEREALTGETTAYGRVFVDANHLAAGLASSHFVARSERNALFRANRLCTDMDAGEKDLFAHLFSHHKTLTAHIVVSTADKGVLVRANEFGWLQNTVSLEALEAVQRFQAENCSAGLSIQRRIPEQKSAQGHDGDYSLADIAPMASVLPTVSDALGVAIESTLQGLVRSEKRFKRTA